MPTQTTAQEAQHLTHNTASHSDRSLETSEQHTAASASAGLNLNLFGAVKGALSRTSKKTTTGEGESVEEGREEASASALAHGRGNAYASAAASEGSSKSKARELEGSASQGEKKAVSSGKRVDHLGIEG